MEVVSNVQFITCYYVKRIVGLSPYMSLSLPLPGTTTSNAPKKLHDVLEVYLTEEKALERSKTLAEEGASSTCPSKTSVSKHLAITTDLGVTVTIIDGINTFVTCL